MKAFHTSVTLMGEIDSISAIDSEESTFFLKLLTEDLVEVQVTNITYYEILRNVGDAWRDRVADPDLEQFEAALGKRNDANDQKFWDKKYKLQKYLTKGVMICVQGVRSEDGSNTLYSARRIVRMHSEPNSFGWEETHWWLQQTNTLFEQWLDTLFQTRREFTENDFSEFYRTSLDLLGRGTDSDIQECATMSRFLYGLSSAYLLTGNERALSAASACAKYLINAYSNSSHDGRYVFWKYGRIKDGISTREIIGSLNTEDRGSYALYEQIYAISGLTQYYRVTQNTRILGYIRRTIDAFEKFYFDENRPDDPCFKGNGGYFSHIDPVTMRPDSESLKFNADGRDFDNRAKKNWNSIGDHIPAYLINLLVSIDPLPVSDPAYHESWVKLRDMCRKILDDCVINILDHFAPEEGVMFVNERFHSDWSVDHNWGWQENRGIVGHNLKISWNLTRCGHYYSARAVEAKQNNDIEVEIEQAKLAERCHEFARDLGWKMRDVGVDLNRGGIFDALERNPANGLQTDFVWSSSKDFWQQEQAILAYYIMHSVCTDKHEKKEFLKLARYCSAFWSLFFVDQDNRKIFFRTTESGEPIIEGQYGIQAGHAIAGYHAFELNYLAHLYIRTFVNRGTEHQNNFVLYYQPADNEINSLNVLPDFFRPNDLEIISIRVNGMNGLVDIPTGFQIDISELSDNSVVAVEYSPLTKLKALLAKTIK